MKALLVIDEMPISNSNIFAECKTIKELEDAYELEHYGCETFEWLGKIDRDRKERYSELLEQQKKQSKIAQDLFEEIERMFDAITGEKE